MNNKITNNLTRLYLNQRTGYLKRLKQDITDQTDSVIKVVDFVLHFKEHGKVNENLRPCEGTCGGGCGFLCKNIKL